MKILECCSLLLLQEPRRDKVDFSIIHVQKQNLDSYDIEAKGKEQAFLFTPPSSEHSNDNINVGVMSHWVCRALLPAS